MDNFKEFNTDPWLKEWKEDVKEKKKEVEGMQRKSKPTNVIEFVGDFIKDRPEVAVFAACTTTAIIGSIIGEKIGVKKGYKLGFKAGLEASKFIGDVDMNWYCPGKDVVKLIIKGMCEAGERTIELTTDAANAETKLKDFQACVTAAKTGADPDMVWDLMNLIDTLPAETVAKLAGVKDVAV